MQVTLVLFLLCFTQLCTSQTLISKWGFDNSLNLPDSGSGSVSTIGGVSFTSFVSGNPSTGKAFGTNNYPAQSTNNEKAGILLKISTTDYKDISLSFDQYNSNTASKKTMIFVSADDTNYTKADSLIVTAGSTWLTKSLDLKSFTNLNNKSEIYIQLVSSFTGSQYAATGSTSTYGTSGTWRFDNIRIFGTASKTLSNKPRLSITSSKSSLFESDSDTALITFTLSDTSKIKIENKVTFSGTGITTGDYSWLDTDTLTINPGSYSATLRVKIIDDTAIEALETGIVSIVNLDTGIILNNTQSINLVDDDLLVTPISSVQGKGNVSGLLNTTVSVEGVVVADLQGTNEQGGYYIQDTNPDTDPETSEGVFIKDTKTAVEEGDFVRVTGKVIEEFGQTVISSISSVIVKSKNNSVVPTNILFPIDSVGFLERYEGMKVKINQQLTVTENYQLGRYGEITASVNGRLINPSNEIDLNDNPKDGISINGTSNLAEVLSKQSLNDRSKILLCDKLSIQNPNPIPFIDSISNTLRSGSLIDTLNGVLGYGFNFYRIYPSVNHPKIKFATRPEIPLFTDANLKIASMNVLNYFNGVGTGDGFPTSRGAKTFVEFGRQRAKIIAAIKAMNADVVGLMEMENDGDSNLSAINDLVYGLNEAYGRTEYDYIRDPKGANGNPGSDEIKVALIYKPSVVEPNGLAKSHNDVAFNLLGRPPLAQTFILKSNAEKFSVIVNHFKSKSCASSPDDPLDKDQLDGQGCFNSTRKKQAASLLTFITTIIQQSNDSDVVTIGDFNAYEQEDPLDMLRANGLKSLTNESNQSYSYVFDGQAGSLDHGFATATMHKLLTGAKKWNINCDEPSVTDYTMTFKTQDLYSNSVYRSSDHDPLIAGFNFILNNDTLVRPTPTVSFVSPVSSSVKEKGGTYTTQVHLSNTSPNFPTSVTISVTGTMSNGEYSVTPMVINFPAGDSVDKNVVINIVDDTAVEANEVLELNIAINSDYAIGANPKFSLTVLNDDTAKSPPSSILNQTFELNLYPIPVSNYLNIDMTNLNVKTCSVSIYHLDGLKLYEGILTKNAEAIDLQSFPNGHYIVRLTSDQFNLSRRITVQH